ncbi:guanylate cyclase soluble subunit beta-2-like isoform X5 [Mercenaria mercenaria]|uniref:guanylate cyclase soluble subunit beta-2-like isoform X1 n=1 Tax=Mercenaria mercenaria TaxID=6596 RepID=UPI001E1E13E8|nr:guanylate cyclase soluble subunit beta-2-like isoform X1 [Mercenaria mercenaria]XP_045165883.1 guanylate cyclase soluble subunit beta-2-like isoform X2 [Mercenaria mercenaria]XP_045165884.1 guanylate cyclase soluble subunit beta-2-like isoform X3 [Mercenaria mercenaria]XP_045165885.1 guanylate cyclase soluble subunit beta-2-like isoform X4 [Mercenaria mercenaria]XP_045165886.1 guanylate cyclase soluble subunit beta-2-like isoform X5 [Mercenaria mercenaria]
MYGQIHVCVRELVEEKFGAEAWKSVLTKSGLDEHDHFLVFHRYEDPVTFKLIGAVCETLGVELPAVLEIFGDYFLQYCLRHGYDKMLKTLGGNFKSFIQNLDSLHALLALTYKNIVAPSFRCETNEDGSLSLHYYTIRPGLYPIVLGLVRAVARDLYNQEADISVVDKSQEVISGGKTQEHVTFRVVLTRQDDTKSLTEFQPSFPSEFFISAEQFCNAFPYHIIFDSNLEIKQCGMMIQRLLRTQVTEQNMCDIFELTHPRMQMSVINIRMFINAVFMLKVRVPSKTVLKNGDSQHSLILKGQMMWLDDIQHMIFISSPRLSSLTELMEMNVYLADIPLYDVTRELVLLNQQRIAEIDIAKRLDETTIELRKTSKALEEEKKKTDLLLYQMLPEKVAIELKNGRPVAAEKFEHVTVLFSDIVTFTNIASACPAISIVQMLNDLYNRFDARSTEHGVYKVETIGDAYMVVSGVPIKTTAHAQPVANFSMDMVAEAAKVMSPATGKPLQIRVGLHSGPVVAGVVGQKMPRYCLFGDTVNTASRMESHGAPGRIHLSPTTFKNLQESKDYSFRCRGEIDVKGKGKMTTFFLIGTKNKRVKEPDDDFSTLEVLGEDDPIPNITYPRGSKQISRGKSSTCTVI